MSSFLSVVLRDKEGRISSSTRLNTYDWFINNVMFLDKDPKHNARYTNEAQLKYEGAEPCSVAPHETGLLILDQKINRISRLTPSYTSSFGYIAFPEISWDIGGFKGDVTAWANHYDSNCKNDETASQRLKELLTAGRLTNFGVWDKKSQVYVSEREIRNYSLDVLGNVVKQTDGVQPPRAFLFNTQPYELREYCFDEVEQMQLDLKNVGFDLSGKCIDDWNSWLREAS